jgi:hypothetical protein
MTERLEDYREVAERITLFYERYPDGRLRSASWEVREIGERLFIVYEALAYRTPDDPLPGQGSAWEPIPGPTPFTKDSELMNAETAAWGRAIVGVGIVASRKIASQEEVKARATPAYGEPPVEPAETAAKGAGRRVPSGAQSERIKQLIAEHNVSRLELAGILDQWDMELSEGWLERLDRARASKLIDTLLKLNQPQVDA